MFFKKKKQKPGCFGSNPSAQAQAENDCRRCDFERDCGLRSAMRTDIHIEVVNSGHPLARYYEGLPLSIRFDNGVTLRFNISDLMQRYGNKERVEDEIQLAMDALEIVFKNNLNKPIDTQKPRD